MPSEFDFGTMPMEAGDNGFFVAYFVFYLLYCVVISAISLGSYVLSSVGVYTVANRRRIHHPWLAWLPLGSNWILGSISDQYQYVTKGKVKNKRKALLILEIILYVVLVLFLVALATMVVHMFDSYDAFAAEMVTSVVAMIATGFVMFGVSVALTVLQYMALYDLYASCDPKNKVLYLVLNIFVSVTRPIMLFICRNKEEGMPPRKAEPQAIPQEPWEQSYKE